MPRGISRYDDAFVQKRLWTPADQSIPMGLWLDGSDLTTITYGTSGISQWNDKSGNARHATQATDANRPTLKLDAYSNLSVVSLIANQWMSSTFSASNSAESLFAVIRVTGLSTRTILGADNTGGRQFRTEGDGQLGFIAQNVSNLALTGVGFTHNVDRFTLVYLEYDNTNTRFLSEGTQLGNTTTVVPNLTAARTTRISRGAGGAEDFVGDIAEIIVCTSKIAGHLRQKIEGYLVWKWGFADKLQSGHRFNSRPPTIGD